MKFFSIFALGAIVCILLALIVGRQDSDYLGAEHSSGKVLNPSKEEGETRSSQPRKVSSQNRDSLSFGTSADLVNHIRSLDYSSSEEISAVFNHLIGLPTGKDKRKKLNLFVSTFGRFPADLAFELLNEVEDEIVYKTGVTAIMTGLIQSDPERASMVLRENLGDPAFLQSKLLFIKESRNSVAGLERLRDVFDGASEKQTNSLMNSLRASPLIEAQQYVTELVNQGHSDEKFGSSRFSSVIRSGGTEKMALKMIAELKDPILRRHEQKKFFAFLTEQDPKSAVTSLSLLPDSMVEEVVPTIVSEWFSMAPTEVGAWIDQMERGSFKDSAILQLIEVMEGADESVISAWRNRLSGDRPE